MKRSLFILLLLVFLVTACNLPTATPGTPAPATDVPPTGAPPTDAPPPTDVPPPTETPTLTPPPTPLTVAYVKNRDVYLWVDGAGSTRLTTAGDVSDVRISDDAQRIVFTKFTTPGAEWGQTELWGINADGSNLRLLINSAALNAINPPEVGVLRQFEFIAGTHVLAYATGYIIEGPGNPHNADLRTIDVDTLTEQVILPLGQAGYFFSYSPDGATVALVKGEEILLVNADGSNRRSVLTFPMVYTYSEWLYLPPPVWAADSASFKVAIPAQDPLGDPAAPSRIYQVTTAGASTLLATFVASPVFLSFIHISPDGSKVGYMGPYDYTAESGDLHVANVDLSGDTIVVSGKVSFDSWAPDSEHFAYWSGNLEVFNVGSIASGFTGLPGGATPMGSYFSWVDASRYLYINRPPGDPELRLGTLSGTSVTIDSGSMWGLGPYDFAP